MAALSHGPPTLEIVVSAIVALYNGDGDQREKADRWLEDFQKTPEAWKISDQILREDGMKAEALMFAAQNLRKKILLDLSQLDLSAREALRDSLLGFLLKFRTLPAVVIRYICLALADLAILMPEWEAPIDQLSYMFTKPDDVNLLLLFIGALPEECKAKKMTTLQTEELKQRRTALIEANAAKVLHMLIVVQNSEISESLRREVLECLLNWITNGDIKLSMLQGCNVIEKAFEALDSDLLFEVAVDLICGIIEETGHYLRNKTEPGQFMETVHLIYKALQALVPAVSQCDDDEKLRGLCRIFAAAGEAYCNLIVGNLEAWKGIVDGLLECSENSDLDVVSITFLFWNMLADAIMPQSRGQFLYIFQRLIQGMIKQLHYPIDESSWTGKERDEFREFRHKVGDVLKDCVVVLGAQEALSKPYMLLTKYSVAGSANGALDPSVPWQNIEAPLFALRTMGEKISDKESNVLPEIMSMLPQLPSHPKVKYAAILVIGRYASWTKHHPEFLPYQMTYVSKGFEDKESIAAASRALKFLCNECGERIVDYLGQLHPFYLSMMNQLEHYERRDLAEALAHVIKHVPVVTPEDGQPNLLKVLEMFCLPMAQRLHEITLLGQIENEKKTRTFKDVQKEAVDLIGQFSIFLDHVETREDLGDNHPCILLFRSMWPILSGLLDLNFPPITAAVCKPLTLFAKRYHPHIRSFLPEVVPKLASSYAANPESTGLLWVASVYLKFFGDEREAEGAAMYQLVEAMTQGAFTMIQKYAPDVNKIPDVVEDYFLLLAEFVDRCPSLFVQSPLLPSFIKCGIACMATSDLNAWVVLFCRFFRNVFKLASPFWRDRRVSLAASSHPFNRSSTPSNPSQQPPSTPSTSPSRPRTPPVVPPPSQPLVDSLVAILRSEATDFLLGVLTGLMYTFPQSDQLQCADGFERALERSMRDDEEFLGKGASSCFVGTLVLLLFDCFAPGEGLMCLANAITLLPEAAVSGEEKQATVEMVAAEVGKRSARGVERVLNKFARSYERKVVR
ncbi:Nuclear import receptor, partial [Dinochytrium kinnereticum]